ncbi:transglycosylase domain-containing protein [Microvirga thermotolerans]|uniref:PBP1A family penicillin-binding protein n=1 Tax=Microvirga thermotolerans TaxID=2651334 RepID=A0A5P9JS22_9HYPH|nr:penicillin-binding protein 1A [Microvirga thermotolerans]QFU14901.1 PBP1A family penicillin-binding protein [Microvirga thermotolerans]
MANGRDRREPSFETPATDAGAMDVRLSPEDRAGGRMAQKRASQGGTPSPRRPARPKKARRRSGSFLRRLAYGAVVLCLWGVIAVGAVVAYYAAQLPPIDQLTVPKRPPNIAILASDGTLLANRGETGGQTVSLKELPPYLPKAFVAIEDRRFYDHFGIDPVGIARAVFRNITHRGVAQGGSTLTQQLAKNLFLTQERTASRKIQEAILALWLERNYSKDQILELYLNRVYFGAGAYGVEAAAQRYYGKSARNVSLSEAAVLAGLVQAPSRLAPNRNPEAAQARAELVIAAMNELGFITPGMTKTALGAPAQPVRPRGAGSVNYAADYVMDVLDDFVGTIESDIVVSTTIDPAMQAAAERALVDELDSKGQKFNVSQGAFVAMLPDGALKALVGGRNYEASQFNRATTARRQPGSSFKPFIYLTAVEQGRRPDDVRDDSPVNYKGWAPENYDRKFRGPVTLRDALALSLNTVAVKLNLEVGPKAVVQTAQRLGIASPLQANPSLALGTSEVTPLELVSAYAPFANGGTGVVPYIITQVKTTDGKTIYRRPPGGGLGRVIDPAAVAMMNEMMHNTFVIGTARRAQIPGWDMAGKTGTTNDYKDAWFVGFTGSLVAGVWLGNDDGALTKRVTGGNLPTEVWHNFMKVALKDQKPVPLPGSEYFRTAPAETPVAQAGSGPAPAGEGAWIPPQQARHRGRDRNFFERLFGL